MKLNNRGFAISTLLYGLMIMSLLIVIALISNLSTNRINTTSFVDKVEDELNRLSLSDTEGDYTGGEVDNNGREYIAPTSGWYKIELWGASVQNQDNAGAINYIYGAYTSGEIDLNKNEEWDKDVDNYIEDLFGAGNMPECIEVIRHIEQNV